MLREPSGDGNAGLAEYPAPASEERARAAAGTLIRRRRASVSSRYGDHAEQVPDPESRVTLGERPATGTGCRCRAWTCASGDADVGSVLRAHRVLARLLGDCGAGRDGMRGPGSERAVARQRGAGDGRLPPDRPDADGGTTRAPGVVDGDLAVHGFRNLWVAGTGVLPTGSQAHPTFSAVSRALRLAEHLAAGGLAALPAVAARGGQGGG